MYKNYEYVKQIERLVRKIDNKDCNYEIYYIIQNNNEKYSLSPDNKGFIFDYMELSTKTLNEIEVIINSFVKKRKYNI